MDGSGETNNAAAVVQTAFIAPGTDLDSDGMADGWERTYTNTLKAFTVSSDTDGDDMTDQQEYLADTSPLDANDKLWITHIERGEPPHTPTYVILEWTSKPTRCYGIEQRPTLSPANPWAELFTFPWPGTSSAGFNQSGDQYFYRVRALRPLSP